MKHRSYFYSMIAALAFASFFVSELEARTWVSADGTKTFEGEFKSYDRASGKVFVDVNGETLTFAKELLSEADIAWLNQTLADIAVPREMPPGAPKYSDVCMRSLFPRGNTLEAAESFYVTRLEWVYLRPNHDFYRKVREKKLYLGGTLVTEASKSSLKGKNQINLQGKHLTRWTGKAQGCANNPAYLAFYVQQARNALGNAKGLQVDNVGLNNAAQCHCTHCIQEFPKYLKRALSPTEWQALGLGVAMDAFDYKEYLLSIQDPAKKDKSDAKKKSESSNGYQWEKDGNLPKESDEKMSERSKVLRGHYVRFQRNASIDFHRKARREINKAAKRYVPMSLNNGSGSWGELSEVFDYGIGELRRNEANAPHIYHASKKASDLGKHQIFTMPKPNGGLVVNRMTIATAYASGGHMLVPWDIFLGPKNRFYGSPNQYAHYFHFVRENAKFFDGYEDAAATGKDINDARYPKGEEPVSIISSSKGVYAFTRARPGEKNAPVVIHLVDWSKKPQASKLILRPNWFFGDYPLQVRLLRPSWKNQPDGTKVPTTSEEVIASGRITEIDLPAMRWGMLVVDYPKTPLAGNAPWQPIITPLGGTLIGTKEISINSYSPHAKVHYTLDGSEPDQNSTTYDGPITIDRPCTIRALAIAKNGGKASAESKVTFDGPIQAMKNPPSLKQGLKYSYHELHVDRLPPNTQRFRQAKKKSGVSQGLDLSLRNKDKSIVFHFRGYLDVPETGVYEFSLRSDDGSRLRLSGHTVAEMNYLQDQPGESSATVALEKGKHPIFVEYFNWAHSKTPVLEVSWEGPNLKKQKIPTSAYYYQD